MAGRLIGMFGPLMITRYDRASPTASGKSALSYVYRSEHAADHTRVVAKSRSLLQKQPDLAGYCSISRRPENLSHNLEDNMGNSDLGSAMAAMRTDLERRLEAIERKFSDDIAGTGLVRRLQDLAALSPENGFESTFYNQKRIDISDDGVIFMEGPLLQLQFTTWWHIQYCIRYTDEFQSYAKLRGGIKTWTRDLEGPDDFMRFATAEVAKLEVMKNRDIGYFNDLKVQWS